MPLIIGFPSHVHKEIVYAYLALVVDLSFTGVCVVFRVQGIFVIPAYCDISFKCLLVVAVYHASLTYLFY